MTPTRRIDAIQWLRAIAAGLVVIEHAKNAISTEHLGLAPSDSPLSIFPFSAGVDLFFVISGFIMAYSSGGLFGRAGGRRIFLLRRLARIAPLYWLTTSFMVLVFIALGSRAWSGTSWPSVAASYLFLPAANAAGEPFPLFVIGWTLNYEMAFYAVFALFIGFRERAALALTAGAIVLIAICGSLFAPEALALRFWTDPIILEFVAGIGLYGLHRGGLLRLSRVARLGLGAAALGVLALHCADPGPWRAAVWGMPAAALVAVALAWSETTEAPSRGSRAALAGDLSYAVYLAHLPVILIGATALRALAPSSAWVWFGLFPILVAAGTLGAAGLLHRLVERPIQQAARRATPPPMATSPALRTPLPSSGSAASPN